VLTKKKKKKNTEPHKKNPIFLSIMDAFIVAMSRYKRRKYDQTLELCDAMLEHNASDQVFILFF
jgi:hypothetical protein